MIERYTNNKEEGQAVNQASGNNVEPSKEEPKDVNELTSDELDNLFRFDSEVA